MTRQEDLNARNRLEGIVRAGPTIARKHLAIVGRTDVREEARDKARLEAEIALAESDIANTELVGKALSTGLERLERTAGELHRGLASTNVILEKASKAMEAAGADSARASKALVFWTIVMVVVVAVQALTAIADLVVPFFRG